MKIVCGSCGAKYSIADEKVQGKVFKIRCRKCSNTIVVKGTQEDASASSDDAHESSSYGGSTGAQEWYAVINGEQSSAMSAEELEAYFYAGQIQADTYIWKEGMANWDSLSGVPTFAHLVQGGPMAGLGYGDISGAPMSGDHDDTYGASGNDTSTPDEATAIGSSPLHNPASYGMGTEEEGATAIVDAKQWRAQQDAKDAAASGGYDAPVNDDPTAAFPRPEGGWDDALGTAEMDPTSQGTYSNDAYASDLGDGDFGSSSADDLTGTGALDYGSDADFGGGSDNLFNTFDADMGNSGGIAYQSFSGIGAAPSDLDLGAAISQGTDQGYNTSYSAPLAGGFNLGTNGSPSLESPDVGYESQDGLIGTRNENSVLFSLSSLQQVNAVSSKSNASKDVPLTDGSGLIDLQSLAATHTQFSGAEDTGLPSGLGSHSPMAEPFSPSTMSLPAIMPRGSHRDNKPLILGLIAAVVLLAGAGVAAAVIISNKPPEDKSVKVIERIVEKAPDTSGENMAKNQQVASELEAIKKQLAEQQAAAAAAAATPGAEEEEEEKASAKKSSGRTPRRGSSTPRKDKDDEPNPAPTRTSKKKSEDGIKSILDGLDRDPKQDKKEEKEEKSAASAPDSKLPKKLDRLVVRDTIGKYSGRVKGCAQSSNSGGLSGSIGVGMKVEPSGRVTDADLKGSKFDGTDVGKCVLGVVRSMKFPPSQDGLTISKYPFIL